MGWFQGELWPHGGSLGTGNGYARFWCRFPCPHLLDRISGKGSKPKSFFCRVVALRVFDAGDCFGGQFGVDVHFLGACGAKLLSAYRILG